MNRWLLLICLAAGAAFLSLPIGCARKAGEPVMFTGKVYDRVQMAEIAGGAFFGKTQYAEVSHAWLLWAYDDFRAEISAGQFGVTGWDDRAECTFFTTAFEAFAQKRYFAQAFHSSIPAPGIAVGAQWYTLAADGEGHSLVVAITERGREFFEPQTGKFVTLTQEQIDSTYHRKFD